jgi:hypothetical protein
MSGELVQIAVLMRRQQLAGRLRSELVGFKDGSIHLHARTWAVKGLRSAA